MIKGKAITDSAQAHPADRSTGQSSAPSRRKYVSPALVVYGRLSDLTGAKGNDSKDGFAGTRQTS